MSIYWSNTTASGLGDRLIDLFLVASLAKVYNKELFLYWNTNYDPNKLQEKIWPKYRQDDFKIENVKQYFNFPNFIHINETIPNGSLIFNQYLGGVYSPITFYNNFINKDISLEYYINTYKTVINQFLPTSKLTSLVKNIPDKLITIHLRRTDKSSEVSSIIDNGIHTNELVDLNNITHLIINDFIKKGYTNFYFASDCEVTKHEYEKLYLTYNIFNSKVNKDFEKTYRDIYIMSKSAYIILSQRHSNFSLFSSMINFTPFIYIYNDCIIHSAEYCKLNHIIFYKDINNEK
jgi:hypothetical protein